MTPKRQLMIGALAVGTIVGGTVALIDAPGPPAVAVPVAATLPAAGSSGVGSELASLRSEEAQLQAAILAARQKLAGLVAQGTQDQSSLTQEAEGLASRQAQLAQEASQLDSERSALAQEAAQLSARQSTAPPAHATTGASSARSSDDGGGGDG
ncbi:MAG TPA: hypothetical protein VNF50_08930 [Acidimicrobiales bacterium]|nr:hypothetical protein [Acidimicrobiales bacterium]